MQLFPRFEVHSGKVKDVGPCECCRYALTMAELSELDEETTYVVEFVTEHVTAPVAKLCHQHLCDMGKEIIDSTPNSGWNRAPTRETRCLARFRGSNAMTNCLLDRGHAGEHSDVRPR